MFFLKGRDLFGVDTDKGATSSSDFKSSRRNYWIDFKFCAEEKYWTRKLNIGCSAWLCRNLEEFKFLISFLI